jgi:hypothetical protein
MKYKVRDPATNTEKWVEAKDPTDAAAQFRAGNFIEPKSVVEDVATQAPVGLLQGGIDLAQGTIPGAVEAAGEFVKPYLGGVNPWDLNSVVSVVTGGLPEAETTPGKITRAVTEIAPGVALNPGRAGIKAVETLTGGLGSYAGEEVGGPWGKFFGSLLGLSTPRAVRAYGARGNKVTLDNLKDAGLTGEKVQAYSKERGLLPADVTERGAGLLETAIKKSTDPETARLPFVKRPVKAQATLDIARETTPSLQRTDELREAAEATLDAFRKKLNVPHNKQLTRTLEIPEVAAVSRKILGGMTPNEVKKAHNSKNVSTAYLERIRSKLETKAESAADANEAKHLRKLAGDLVKFTKDKDWEDAVELGKRGARAEKVESNIGSVLDPKMSDSDLIKALTEATGKPPSKKLIENIRDMQRVARTNEAAGGERVMGITTPSHPGVRIAGGVAAHATGHPFIGSAMSWAGVKDIIKKAGGRADRKRADRIVRALSDPDDPIWTYKPPSAAPGIPGIIPTFERLNRGQR